MADWIGQTEDIVYSGRIKVPYEWSVGETGSRFLVALRDEKKILGTFCGRCQMVFVPPRKVCGRCFNADMEWRELGPQGTLITYTVPRYKESIHPLSHPFGYGIILLDGATTGLVHLLGGFDGGGLQTGIRVEAVFREQRKGDILDIMYFKPV
jgi:uncharacterized OB-fold protein